MLCLACDDENSLTSVPLWLSEIRKLDATKPIVLVMTKADRRKDCENAITDEQLYTMRRNYGLQGIYKSSAQAQSENTQKLNVHKVFNRAILTASIHKNVIRDSLMKMKTNDDTAKVEND